MKYLILSDIHDGIDNLNTVLDIYKSENCDKLIVLGDLPSYIVSLNFGKIIDKLNEYKNDLYYVKGNCDFNLSLDVDTPFIQDIDINGYKTTITHGHLFNKEYLSNLDSKIIITGHTHKPVLLKSNKIYLNPGSITKSRSGENSFIIIDNNLITLRNLKNEVLQELKIEK